MRRPLASRGYTIVEVMIFLVVTSVLLVSGMLVFRGRQQRTQFTQGVREVETQIRTIINETASGFYPNRGNLSCTGGNGAGPDLDIAESDQGTNSACIFLGRAIQFTNGERYYVYTVVGQRQGADGKEVNGLGNADNQAKQTVVATSDLQPESPNDVIDHRLPWGIRVTKIATTNASTPVDVGALAFIASFAKSGDDGLTSGSSNLNLIPLVNSSLNDESNDRLRSNAMATAIRDMGGDPVNPGRVVICLSNGDRRAAIIIGNKNNTSTDVTIDDVPEECSS